MLENEESVNESTPVAIEEGASPKAVTIRPEMGQQNDDPLPAWEEMSPELTVDLEYIFAHAINSIKGGVRPKVKAQAGSKLKSKPTASPVGSGAARGGKRVQGKAETRYGKFTESGSSDDWVAARIAKFAGI